MNFMALLLSILSFLGLTWLFGGGLKSIILVKNWENSMK